jgi:hypothetical protein
MGYFTTPLCYWRWFVRPPLGGSARRKNAYFFYIPSLGTLWTIIVYCEGGGEVLRPLQVVLRIRSESARRKEHRSTRVGRWSTRTRYVHRPLFVSGHTRSSSKNRRMHIRCTQFHILSTSCNLNMLCNNINRRVSRTALPSTAPVTAFGNIVFIIVTQFRER